MRPTDLFRRKAVSIPRGRRVDQFHTVARNRRHPYQDWK